jgi:2-dehydropantoate 2-reductase
MKIGIVGCGAVGSFYGAQLWRVGHEVHFLLRSDWAAVRARGVRVVSSGGDFVARPHAARSASEVGVCDLVVVALKTTANSEFRRLLPPMVGPSTWVLTLQNGLGNEQALAELCGPARILGGLCFVCLNRIEPGVIRHMAYGGVVLGQHAAAPTAFVSELAAEWGRAGVNCAVTADLERAHWEKLVWNVPFNGLGVAGGVGYEQWQTGSVAEPIDRVATLPTDELLGDARWIVEVEGLMREVLAAAAGVGFPLSQSLAEEMIARTRSMGAYKASTLLDYERGRPLEVEALFREPLRRAERARVATPRLARLAGLLEDLDRRQTVRRGEARVSEPPFHG